MSIPKFKISQDELNNLDEAKLFDYLNNFVSEEDDSIDFNFNFSSEKDLRLIAFKT